MPSPSKAKGNAWERALCEHLTSVFGLPHTRVPNSGAFIGGMNNYRVKALTQNQQLLFEGDIIPPDELNHVKYECKSYRDFAFHQLFSKNKLLDSWIEQSKSEKMWFLVFKITNKESFVLFDSNRFNFIITGNYLKYNNYTIVALDSFFETNKISILNASKQQNRVSVTAVPTLSS